MRSLGAQGIEVVCASERKSAMGLYSRYVTKSFVYTSPAKNQHAFIEKVVAEAQTLFVKDGVKPVVFCCSDATALTLAREYETLGDYMVLPIPSLSSIEKASDKKATYILATELGIPTITTYAETEFEKVEYPAVVKNNHSIVWKNNASISGSASFVFSKSELENMFASLLQKTGEAPLVQEFVKGDEYGVEMVCDSGTAVALFVHKRIRSLSPHGGAAVVKETALETPEVDMMKSYAQALVSKLLWHGPIMVEFKLCEKTRRVLLMEINGRFWGSLPLPVKAGIDFPLMTYKLGTNTLTHVDQDNPKHIRTRHFLGDCRWLLAVLFKKDRLRAVLYPSRIRALWDFKLEFFKSKGDIFAVTDLKPCIMEYVDHLGKLFTK